jgi:methionyl aminopeptidase
MGMILYKSEDDLTAIREGAQILGKAHGEVAKELKPGVTTKKLNERAEEFIRDSGGVPSFKGFNKFPAALCTSLNEYVVHGIPDNYVLQEGDILSVDCGVYYKGFHSDSAFTYPVGAVSDEVIHFLRVTREALYSGIKEAKEGNRMGDVGYAIQSCVQAHGYSVVRELGGHGVGRALHEDPHVPNYGKKGQGILLKRGMVLAIEPIVNLGARNLKREAKGQFRTLDRKLSAHFEHTLTIVDDQPEILTTHKYIEEIFKF